MNKQEIQILLLTPEIVGRGRACVFSTHGPVRPASRATGFVFVKWVGCRRDDLERGRPSKGWRSFSPLSLG